MPQLPANLSQLLQRLRDQTEGQVSIGDLLAAVGQRSFGPIVLVAGLMGS